MAALILYNLVALIIGALACLSVAGVYMYLHRGWKDNSFALMMIPSLISKGVLFTWLSIVRLLPEGEYRQYVSSALFTAVVGTVVYRAYVYFKEEIKLGRERYAANHVGLSEREVDLQSDPQPGDGSGVR